MKMRKNLLGKKVRKKSHTETKSMQKYKGTKECCPRHKEKHCLARFWYAWRWGEGKGLKNGG